MPVEFIFTENSFEVDDRYDYKGSDAIMAERFIFHKYEALYEYGFLTHLKKTSPSAYFLHMLSSLFIDHLSKQAELEVARENVKIEITDDLIQHILEYSPFALGSEYLDADWVTIQLEKLNDEFAKQVKDFDGHINLYLQSKSQNLEAAKRIYFHIVENPHNHEYLFAFLATYATKDDLGHIKHMPLKHALIEYENNRDQLVALLSSLNQVADQVEMIAHLMNTGELFHPIKLKASETYELLKNIPIIEKCKITCRVPNWWQRKSSSINLSVKMGEEKPSLLGFDSLVSMKPSLVVNGKVLTREEIEQLLQQEEGLTWLKGQWVEINHHRLKELLEEIKHYDGTITLKEALTRSYMSDNNGNADVGVRISNGDWLRNLMNNLKAPNTIKQRPLPNDFTATLCPYQNDGYNWLSVMNDYGFGACLADDMGLGKTVQVIAFLEKLRESKHGQILLIVPASLLGNWSKEFDRFAPDLDYRILHDMPKDHMKQCNADDPKFLNITTYTMAGHLDFLNTVEWQALILDEAQAIKNSKAKQTKTIKQIPARERIALTGTPIENDYSNLWSLFDFLNKGLLGTSTEFKTFINQENATYKLKQMVSPFILRRVKTDKAIISDLPPKVEINDFVSLSKRQVILYRKEIAALKRKMQLEMDDGSTMQKHGLVLAALTKLKQICNHPDQFTKDTNFVPSDSGKFGMLKDLCTTIYEKRERVLVFTQYKEMCQPLSDYLKTIFHKSGYIINGSVSVKKRNEIVAAFNADAYVPYIVLSLRAAGTGLNLTAANHVIHFDRWWNPAVENQASDRAYRIGQKKTVFVHKLISTGTVEEKIDQLIQSKQDLANEILTDSKQTWITEMDNEQILNLFKLEV